jgi:GMP synthase-like glutamine amidotransferase
MESTSSQADPAAATHQDQADSAPVRFVNLEENTPCKWNQLFLKTKMMVCVFV